MLERMIFERYWSYYLSIEDMLKKTRQYVSASNENRNTYSDEFSKIILLSCSEIDSILKLMCRMKGITYEERRYNMLVYSEVLLQFEHIKEMAYSPDIYTANNEKALIVFPFKYLDKSDKCAGLKWWNDYQKIKHNRLDNAKRGDLFTAVSAVVAHYILLRYLADFLDNANGKDYVKENYYSRYLIPCV